MDKQLGSAEEGGTMCLAEKLPWREASGEVAYELRAVLPGHSAVAAGSLRENGKTVHTVAAMVAMVVIVMMQQVVCPTSYR